LLLWYEKQKEVKDCEQTCSFLDLQFFWSVSGNQWIVFPAIEPEIASIGVMVAKLKQAVNI